MNKITNIILCLTAFLLIISRPALSDSIPYFVSLKNDEVNARTGPGKRFPIDWVYQEKHYPVEVIDKFEYWLQIREYDGTTTWVHQQMLSSARYGLILEDCKLYAKPIQNAPVVGLIQRNVLGRIIQCPAQSDYCLMDFQTVKGWINKSYFWGLYPNEVID